MKPYTLQKPRQFGAGVLGDLDLDNCCGILGKRFRIPDKRMNLSADKCTNITNACVALNR